MKRIGIKASQSLGVNAHGAESHTIVEFRNILSPKYSVDIIGPEVFPEEIDSDHVYTYIKYIRWPGLLRKVLHIPVSIINTLIYSFRKRPDLLFVGGGVFYNGLAILIAGKLLGIKVLVRSAEDHFNYYRYLK